MRAVSTMRAGLGADESLNLIAHPVKSCDLACSVLPSGQMAVCQSGLNGMCWLNETNAHSLQGCERSWGLLGCRSQKQRESITQKCKCALRCPLAWLVHSGDYGRTKLLATTFGLAWGVKWDGDGEELITQPPALVFMCDLPLPCLFFLILPLSLRSHIAVGLLPSFYRNCFCTCDTVASAEA